MSNGTVQPYEFENRIISVHVIDGDPWFESRDLATLLEIRERDLLSALDQDEKMRDTVAGMVIDLISEPGMFSTILRSRKPEARRFKRWVTHEVLPAIRKTGAYVSPAAPVDRLDLMQTMIDQMREDRDRIAATEQAIGTHNQALLELGARTERLEAGYERLAATGYANLRGLRHDVAYLNRLGRAAANIARRDSVAMEKAHSTIFGTVNAWPVAVWDEALTVVGG